MNKGDYMFIYSIWGRRRQNHRDGCTFYDDYRDFQSSRFIDKKNESDFSRKQQDYSINEVNKQNIKANNNTIQEEKNSVYSFLGQSIALCQQIESIMLKSIAIVCKQFNLDSIEDLVDQFFPKKTETSTNDIGTEIVLKYTLLFYGRHTILNKNEDMSARRTVFQNKVDYFQKYLNIAEKTRYLLLFEIEKIDFQTIVTELTNDINVLSTVKNKLTSEFGRIKSNLSIIYDTESDDDKYDRILATESPILRVLCQNGLSEEQASIVENVMSALPTKTWTSEKELNNALSSNKTPLKIGNTPIKNIKYLLYLLEGQDILETKKADYDFLFMVK